MPTNYPNNINLIDKSLVLSNNSFNQPVTIKITYNLSLWAWFFRWFIRRKPAHQIHIAGCQFVPNSKGASSLNIEWPKMVKS